MDSQRGLLQRAKLTVSRHNWIFLRTTGNDPKEGRNPESGTEARRARNPKEPEELPRAGRTLGSHFKVPNSKVRLSVVSTTPNAQMTSGITKTLITYTIQLMIARWLFLPSMANTLKGFCHTHTLCSTYYTRELFPLTSGEVLVLEPMAAQKVLTGKRGKSAVKKPVSLNET